MATATTSKRNGAEAKARPIHQIGYSRIRAAIWENHTDKGIRHNVTLQRVYLDDSGQWKSTDSFGRDDLLLLAKIADLAHTWICENAD